MGQEVPAKHNAINIKAKNRANKRKRQTQRFLLLFSSVASHVGQALWGSAEKDKIKSRTYLHTFL